MECIKVLFCNTLLCTVPAARGSRKLCRVFQGDWRGNLEHRPHSCGRQVDQGQGGECPLPRQDLLVQSYVLTNLNQLSTAQVLGIMRSWARKELVSATLIEAAIDSLDVQTHPSHGQNDQPQEMGKGEGMQTPHARGEVVGRKEVRRGQESDSRPPSTSPGEMCA